MRRKNKTPKQQVLSLPSSSIWNDIVKSDKYNIEGWNISSIKSPSFDSSTNKSICKSDDSDMKGKYSYLRLGGPDKYVVSSILNGSNSMSSIVDFKRVVQHYGHDHNVSMLESISRYKPLHRRYDARDDDDDDDDDDDKQIRKCFKGDHDCNSESSTDSSSYHEHNSTVFRRSRNNIREENYIDDTERSSSYDHYISPSTTVSATQNSSICDHYSSGTMLTASSVTSISDTYDGDNEHSGTDSNLHDVYTDDSKVSSVSYSYTTYSSSGDDYSKSRPRYTDQMGLLFAETLDDDARYDDVHKHDESYENGGICNSDVCVDAIVDLPWIFDELEEGCHYEGRNMKKEMVVIREKIDNYTGPTSNKLKSTSISVVETKTGSGTMSIHEHPTKYEDYANINATKSTINNSNNSSRIQFVTSPKDKTLKITMKKRGITCSSVSSKIVSSPLSTQDETPKICDTNNKIYPCKVNIESISSSYSPKDDKPKTIKTSGGSIKSDVSSICRHRSSFQKEALRADIESKYIKEKIHEADVNHDLSESSTVNPIIPHTILSDKDNVTYNKAKNDHHSKVPWTAVLTTEETKTLGQICSLDDHINELEWAVKVDDDHNDDGLHDLTTTNLHDKSSNIVTSEQATTTNKLSTLSCIVILHTLSGVEMIYSTKKVQLQKSLHAFIVFNDKHHKTDLQSLDHYESQSLVNIAPVNSKHHFKREWVAMMILSFCNRKELTISEGNAKHFENMCMVSPKKKDDNDEYEGLTFLIGYICKKNWNQALTHIDSFPHEAQVWSKIDVAKMIEKNETGCILPNKELVLPLHAACYASSPLYLVKSLINAYPEAIRQKLHSNAKLPLHIACQMNADPQVISHLINTWPMSIYVCNGEGNIPLAQVILSKSPLSPKKRSTMNILLHESKNVRIWKERNQTYYSILD